MSDDGHRMSWLGAKRKLTAIEQERVNAGECMADCDGDCYWSHCPQAIDNGAHYQGKGCPRYLANKTADEDEGRAGG